MKIIIPPFIHSTIQKICKLHRSLSPERVLVVWILLAMSCISFFAAIVSVNQKYLISVPAYGGTVVEGIVGTPRFVNPVLATTDQDRDIVTLTFAGLTKKIGDVTILDMAESVTPSEDGLRYHVIIKENATFHDGETVTSDDVIFTVDKIQNPLVKSPHRVEWEGVSIEKIDEKELVFILKKPFPLFLETLSIGILPKHVWKNLSDEQLSLSDLNIKAVGSGPFSIDKIETSSGIPTRFTFKAHDSYTLGRPYLDTIDLYFYQNEKYLLKAYQDGDIRRIHGIAPENVEALGVSTSSIHTSLLPRTFALFFNPNKSAPLADKNVRQGLQTALDKDKIVRDALYGYATVVTAPYPFDKEQPASPYDVAKAKELLLKNKILRDSLTVDEKQASSSPSGFTISLITANTDQMKKVAEIIKSDWEKVGITTVIKLYDVSDLNQNIIKERDFEVLLFGAITENPSDLYAFWHSTQRNYPGLNISNYASKSLDDQLEILRTSLNLEDRYAAYASLKSEFLEEVPGVYLFAPSLVYITNDKVVSELPAFGKDNASRFLLAEKWHRYTDLVWPNTYGRTLLEKIQNSIH